MAQGLLTLTVNVTIALDFMTAMSARLGMAVENGILTQAQAMKVAEWMLEEFNEHVIVEATNPHGT